MSSTPGVKLRRIPIEVKLSVMLLKRETSRVITKRKTITTNKSIYLARKKDYFTKNPTSTELKVSNYISTPSPTQL